MLKRILIVLFLSVLVLSGCGRSMEDQKEKESSDIETEQAEDSSEETELAEKEKMIQKKVQQAQEQLGLKLQKSNLEDMMLPMFREGQMLNETVMFLERGDTKALLYPIDEILSVTSYDRKIVYEEGKDYLVVDGKLQVTEQSAIPCITAKVYYAPSDGSLYTTWKGQPVPTHWGEGSAMTSWQVNVNYTHSQTWEGYQQTCRLDVYQNFIKKLQSGEDVTIFFYGDSITYGANSSWYQNVEPYQRTYPMMFTQALADLFGYTVRFVNPNLAVPNSTMRTPPVPTEDYVAGNRGVITYINTSIGGWNSTDGAGNFDAFVREPIEKYGCDLLVLAFGMNDGGFHPYHPSIKMQSIIDRALKYSPEAAVALVSTMVPNPNATNGWYGNQDQHEKTFEKLAEQYQEKGVDCAVVCMTSVSLAVLGHKEFHDYSGNNINHPNDFFARVYAQTMLQAVIGYENLE